MFYYAVLQLLRRNWPLPGDDWRSRGHSLTVGFYSVS